MIEVKQARNFSYTKKSMMNDTIRLAFVCLLVGDEASAQQKKAKPYTEGQTYAVGDVVALPEGNAIAVEIVKPKGPAGEGGSLSLKIKISGPLQVIAFTFGQDKSTITLGGGENIVAATAASFAMNEVAATPSGPQLVSRMRTGADAGTLVLDTNEHPLVVEFPIGPESTRGSMQLELKEFTIGRQKYSLKYTLPRANAVKPWPDDSGAGPQKVGEHHEVRVVGVEIVDEWTMFPGMSGAPTVKAKAGERLVAVEFAAKDLRTGKDDTNKGFSGFEVEDASGKIYRSPIGSSDVRRIPFGLVDPTTLRVFRTGGVAFDIEAMSKNLRGGSK